MTTPKKEKDLKNIKARARTITSQAAYGSDIIVDLLQQYGIEYASLNPGASFRGLHDSIVNYGGNRPEIIECTHEKVAVMLAHGYARSAGKPMVAVLHDLVGLLHGAMGIYYAFVDEVPMVVLGGAGPMDATRRRPYIDWIHSAQNQGDAIRDFTKWDDQPYSLSSLPESFARAYGVASTEPKGPVYIGLDISLQEDSLPHKIDLVDRKRLAPQVLIGYDPETLGMAAKMLVAAKRPVVLADRLGRNPSAVDSLVELADLLSIPVVDLGKRFNFPNTHPLDLTGSDILSDADLVLALDVKNLYSALRQQDYFANQTNRLIKDECRIIDIGLRDLGIKGWAQDFDRLPEADLRVLADTSLALPQLLAMCKGILGKRNRNDLERRAESLKVRHDALRKGWLEQSKTGWDSRPISTGRLAWEIWEAIKPFDWVLTGNTLSGWARKLWDWEKPEQYPGAMLGAGTEISISLGVALAHKGSDKLIVAVEPDGDLLYDSSALWIASHHNLPMLVVMYNNRAYYNDWRHQEVIASRRGRPEKNAYVGMELNNPPPDFATLARSFGWHAEGPIENPNEISGALHRAIRVIQEKGQPALIDAVTQFR